MQADDTKVSADLKSKKNMEQVTGIFIDAKNSTLPMLQNFKRKEGLTEVPINEKTSASSTHEDLLELQERITKEILNSKLKESEMMELKVRY